MSSISKIVINVPVNQRRVGSEFSVSRNNFYLQML